MVRVRVGSQRKITYCTFASYWGGITEAGVLHSITASWRVCHTATTSQRVHCIVATNREGPVSITTALDIISWNQKGGKEIATRQKMWRGRKKRRKYDQNYLRVNFTSWTGDTDCTKAIVHGVERSSIDLHMKHANVSQKPFAKQLKTTGVSCVGSTKDTIWVSYLLSYRIARKGLPHTSCQLPKKWWDVCLERKKQNN